MRFDMTIREDLVFGIISGTDSRIIVGGFLPDGYLVYKIQLLSKRYR